MPLFAALLHFQINELEYGEVAPNQHLPFRFFTSLGNNIIQLQHDFITTHAKLGASRDMHRSSIKYRVFPVLQLKFV